MKLIQLMRKQSTERYSKISLLISECLLYAIKHFISLASGLNFCCGEACFQLNCSSSVDNVFSCWLLLRSSFFHGILWYHSNLFPFPNISARNILGHLILALNLLNTLLYFLYFSLLHSCHFPQILSAYLFLAVYHLSIRFSF